MQEDPNIEFEQNWSVGLGATLGANRKLKNIFLVRRIFPGKADSAIFSGFERTINSQKLMKIVRAIFEKLNFFFLCELPFILRVDRKVKTRVRDICERTLDIDFERDRPIGLGSTFGDGQTDTHTDIFFCKTLF